MDEVKLTHKDVVARMKKHLQYNRDFQCGVVIAELRTQNSETPDVIGWRTGAGSILIEAKVSRSDFFADERKWFRRHEGLGMGDERYVAAPKGMIKVDELPEKWGLLEIKEGRVYLTRESGRFECDKRRECIMLTSVLRRLQLSTAVFVVSEGRPDEEEKNPPS